MLSVLFFLGSSAPAQRTAILTPDQGPLTARFAEELAEQLTDKLKVLDRSMAAAAFASVKLDAPFNLTTADAKRIGTVIGCDFFILVRTGTQRRAALERPDYYEAFAAVFTASSRTGRLVYWKLHSTEAQSSAEAESRLSKISADQTNEIVARIQEVARDEARESTPLSIEEVPDPLSPLAKGFRPPVPFRRLKPEYTRTASLYDVAATVDIEVDLDAAGQILRTQIVRWAGFGLDEAVTAAVRAMNWRQAERSGKPLPIRFLLRYNFRKVEKE